MAHEDDKPAILVVEDDAALRRGTGTGASLGRNSVQLACFVKNYASPWKGSIWNALEAVQHFFFPLGRRRDTQGENGY